MGTSTRLEIIASILGGMQTDACIEKLTRRGLRRGDVKRQIAAIAADPSFQIADDIARSARTVEQIVSIYGKLWLRGPAHEPLPEYGELTTEIFLRHFSNNEPFLVRKAASHWPAVTRWTPQSLAERFGSTTIEYMKGSDRYADEAPKKRTTLRTFGKWLERRPVSNEYYLTATNFAFRSLQELQAEVGDFRSVIPLEIAGEDVFRLWLGPRGTLTTLHYDLMPVLFVQIYGSKRFLLASPFVLDWMGELRGVFSGIDPVARDTAKFPRSAELHFLQADVNAGDLLYIPMGWWHWVYALTQSISFNLANFSVAGKCFRLDDSDSPKTLAGKDLRSRISDVADGRRLALPDAQTTQSISLEMGKLRKHPAIQYLRAKANQRRTRQALVNSYADLWLQFEAARTVHDLPDASSGAFANSYFRNVPLVSRNSGGRTAASSAPAESFLIAKAAYFSGSENPQVRDHRAISKWSRQRAARLIGLATGSAEARLLPPFFHGLQPCAKSIGGKYPPCHDACPFCYACAVATLDERDILFVPQHWWVRFAPSIAARLVECDAVYA